MNISDICKNNIHDHLRIVKVSNGRYRIQQYKNYDDDNEYRWVFSDITWRIAFSFDTISEARERMYDYWNSMLENALQKEKEDAEKIVLRIISPEEVEKAVVGEGIK